MSEHGQGVSLRRRTIPEQLRYLADQLDENALPVTPISVALSLRLMADKIEEDGVLTDFPPQRLTGGYEPAHCRHHLQFRSDCDQCVSARASEE